VASLWGAERCLRVLESVSTAQLGFLFHRSTVKWMVTFIVPFIEGYVQRRRKKSSLIKSQSESVIIFLFIDSVSVHPPILILFLSSSDNR